MSCGKTRFPTFTAARDHAERARRRRDQPFHAYHCLECNAFHYGARPFQTHINARFRRAKAMA